MSFIDLEIHHVTHRYCLYEVVNYLEICLICLQGVNDLFSGASSTIGGSLSVSSSVLLAKMKRRNAHHLPEAGGRNIHSTEHHDLLKELRGFIAHQCKRDGQATTDEILNKFAKTLAPSESAVFRSMLHEVCDFHRSHGDGIWTLKSDYR